MLIAFHSDQISGRGTSVALYDYAHYNEILLGNKSIVLFPRAKIKECDMPGIVKFAKRFSIKTYNDKYELEKILFEEKCSILYCIKYGKNDGIFSNYVKTVIHCVFDMSEPHGDVYAGVSRHVAKKYGCNTFVPHMISLTPSKDGKNLRKELGIPDESIVFGRYGGMDTMDLRFCWEVISEVVNKYNNIYFIFINTPKIITHKNIKYLEKIYTEDDKNKFICTCDAHIECGSLGHSFGLAIGEFSVNDKPIIAYIENLWNYAHIEILGDKGIYYRNKEEFYNILTTFDRKKYTNMNCYKEYSPENVMSIFQKTFIDT